MNELKFSNSFFRVVRFTFKSTFKSAKLYIFMFFIPLCIYIFSYLYNSNFDYEKINPAIMLSKLLIPSICSIFLVTSIITEWNRSIFIRQIKIFKINFITFVLAILFIFIIINIIFLLIFLTATVIIDLFLQNKSMIDALKINSYYSLIKEESVSFIVNFRRALGIIFVFFLSFVVYFFIGYCLASFLKNAILCQLINIFLILIFLILGDQFIDPNNSSFYNSTVFIGYLIPQKYFTWLIYLFYIDIGTNSEFINLVIINLALKLFVWEYNLPIFIAILFTLIFVSLPVITFKLKEKEKYEKIN